MSWGFSPGVVLHVDAESRIAKLSPPAFEDHSVLLLGLGVEGGSRLHFLKGKDFQTCRGPGRNPLRESPS